MQRTIIIHFMDEEKWEKIWSAFRCLKFHQSFCIYCLWFMSSTEGLEQWVGSNMQENVEGSVMKQFFREFKGLVPRHGRDVSSREEMGKPGYLPVNQTSYRLNSQVENNFTSCIYIQLQSSMSEHAVTSYLNWLPQWWHRKHDLWKFCWSATRHSIG